MARTGQTDRAGQSKPLVVIANPSADVYGSDLQMLETVTALIQGGCDVVVTTPRPGPLVERLTSRGASVELLDYPVLTKALARPGGAVTLGAQAIQSAFKLARYLRAREPSCVFVNTVTLPWWILAARLAGVTVICHVHEAERQEAPFIRRVLYGPLLAAHLSIMNSRVTLSTVTEAVPQLRRRTRLVYNGVPGPEGSVEPISILRGPFRLVLVSRLSPRKGVGTALEAVALLRQAGREVRLTVCGTPAAGYEWFEEQLQQRAGVEDLAGAVTFAGYVDPVWPALRDADAVLATSMGESLGNSVIEAQLCGRPVIASDVCGHDETIEDEATGILVPPGDPAALAAAIGRVIDDPSLALRLAQEGQRVAQERFSVSRYHAEMRSVVTSTLRATRRNAHALAFS